MNYLFQKSCITGHYRVRANLDYYVIDFDSCNWLEPYMPNMIDIHYTLKSAIDYITKHKQITLEQFNSRKK